MFYSIERKITTKRKHRNLNVSNSVFKKYKEKTLLFKLIKTMKWKHVGRELPY